MSEIVLYRWEAGKEQTVTGIADKTLSITKIGNIDYYCAYDSVVKPNLDFVDLFELKGALFYPCDSISKIVVNPSKAIHQI